MFPDNICQVLLLVAVVVGSGYSQQHYCSYPSSTELESVIAAIISSGDAAAEPTITLMDFNPVCRSFTDRQDLLRGVSVVVHYTCSGHNSCPSGTVVEQIESGCESGQWTNRVEGSTSLTRSESTEANLSTTARDDCSACVSPELASELGVTTDSVTHCVACNSTCDQGLMRCSGPSASDCCNFYNNSVCVEQCPSPFMSNSDSICVCPERTTGHNCEDDVDCGSLTDPVNGTISLTGTATATYSCNDGYSLVGDTTRTCLASASWSGDEPTCRAVDCGGLADPANGAVRTSGETFTSSATYSCNDGYSLVGDTTRTCLASGLWSGEPPLCCTTNCIDCDVDGCKVCGAGYKLENGVCKCVVTGCSSCESYSSKCDTCEVGRRLDDDKSACSECAVTGCSNCDSDVSKCDTCEEGRLSDEKSACITGNDGGSENDDDNGLSIGAIIGIVIACIVAVVVIVVVVIAIALYAVFRNNK